MFMCCLRTCICRACRVGQTLGQWGQKTPPILTCFDSMWFMRPFLCMAGYWHSRHSHPWSVLFISSTIRFSISEGNSGNNNHVALSSLLVYCLWYLELWIVRAFLVGQNWSQRRHWKPGLDMCLASMCREMLERYLEAKSHSAHWTWPLLSL